MGRRVVLGGALTNRASAAGACDGRRHPARSNITGGGRSDQDPGSCKRGLDRALLTRG